MNTKLTLSIEQSLITKAKEYAKSKGRSLSDIIENYLKVITTTRQPEQNEHTTITASLRGSFRTPKTFDYKADLTRKLSEKYIPNE